MVSASVAVKFT